MLPAPAGVSLQAPLTHRPRGGAPRTCGGKPGKSTVSVTADSVLPAPAGVSRARTDAAAYVDSAPRTCGGKPVDFGILFGDLPCSPHLRG